MRKHIYFLWIICLSFCATLALASCGGDDDDATSTVTASISASSTTLSFGGEAESQSITITASQEWGSYTSDTWITISPSSSTSTSAAATVSVSKNTLLTARTGTVTLTCGAARATITISQEAGDGSEDPDAIAVPSVVPNASSYKIVFDDEFDQTSKSLNSTYWTHEVQSKYWVNSELQNYVKETSPSGQRVTEVKNGRLYINCFREDGEIYSGRVYANVNTGFTYGYFEARIKLPSGKGTWPAWWMMPANNDYSSNPWPGCGEIDIMEEVGVDANWVSATIHNNIYNNGNTATEHGSLYVDTAESDFHNYGCEWTSTYLAFYVDGEQILKYAPSTSQLTDKNYWPFNVPFYPILNLAFGGSWGGYAGVDYDVVDNGISMQVEYVRVFQR